MNLFLKSLKMMFSDLNTAGKAIVVVVGLSLLIWILF
jgi:hypothetical protein